MDCGVPSLCVVLMLASSPQPSSAIVLGSRLGVPAAKAGNVLSSVSHVLRAKGLQAIDEDELGVRLKLVGMRDPTQCAGRRPCFIELGKQLKVERLFVVSVAEVKPDLSIAVEVLELDTGKRLASSSGVIDADSRSLDADVGPLATELLKSLGIAPPLVPIVPIAPLPQVVTREKPAPPPPSAPAPTPVPVRPAAVSRPQHKAVNPVPWLLAGASVLAFGGGLVLGIDGGNRGSRVNEGALLDDGRIHSSLTEADATALATQASIEVAFAIGLGAVMLICGALAVWLGTSEAR